MAKVRPGDCHKFKNSSFASFFFYNSKVDSIRKCSGRSAAYFTLNSLSNVNVCQMYAFMDVRKKWNQLFSINTESIFEVFTFSEYRKFSFSSNVNRKIFIDVFLYYQKDENEALAAYKALTRKLRKCVIIFVRMNVYCCLKCYFTNAANYSQ